MLDSGRVSEWEISIHIYCMTFLNKSLLWDLAVSSPFYDSNPFFLWRSTLSSQASSNLLLSCSTCLNCHSSLSVYISNFPPTVAIVQDMLNPKQGRYSSERVVIEAEMSIPKSIAHRTLVNIDIYVCACLQSSWRHLFRKLMFCASSAFPSLMKRILSGCQNLPRGIAGYAWKDGSGRVACGWFRRRQDKACLCWDQVSGMTIFPRPEKPPRKHGDVASRSCCSTPRCRTW